MPQHPRRRSAGSWTAFVARTAAVWGLMVVVLVLVPDLLSRSLGPEVARVVGWAVACGLWVVTVEAEWKTRVGPVLRFVAQLTLWVAAALTALWIADITTAFVR